MERDPRSRVILVTGVSSGIGRALARRLWTASGRVVVTARRDSLGELQGEPFRDDERFLVRPLDVTRSEEREAVVREIEARWGGVDVLVNNAGVNYRGVMEHIQEDEALAQLRTNFFGPMELVRLVLPSMRRRRWGRIVNVSSVGGMMAMPTMGVYSASKWALEGASEALWYELRPFGIAVTLVQPGFIHSGSFRRVTLTRDARAALQSGSDDYAPVYRHMARFIERLMDRAIATPESVAGTVLDVVSRRSPPLRVPATADATFFSMLRRLLPRRLYHAILYRNLPGIEEWGGPR